MLPGYLTPQKGATAEEMTAFLRECLEPHFGHMMLRFSRQHLGDEDGVYVSYNSVPLNTTGVDVLNTWATPKFSIYAGKGTRWPRDGAVNKVQVKMFSGGVHRGHSFRGLEVPFRAKTGTPEQVVEYLVRFFLENSDVLLPDPKSMVRKNALETVREAATALAVKQSSDEDYRAEKSDLLLAIESAQDRGCTAAEIQKAQDVWKGNRSRT